MWLMLQQEKADDFVVATNETHSVREFVEKSFGHVNIKIRYAHSYISFSEVLYHHCVSVF